MLNKSVKYRVTFTAHGDVLRRMVDAVHESELFAPETSDRAVDEYCGILKAIRGATPVLQDDDDE